VCEREGGRREREREKETLREGGGEREEKYKERGILREWGKSISASFAVSIYANL
jgi:hypothetical protein